MNVAAVDVARAGDSPVYRYYRLPSIAVSARGTVLVACEGGNPARLAIARFSLEWLTDGRDSLS